LISTPNFVTACSIISHRPVLRRRRAKSIIKDQLQSVGFSSRLLIKSKNGNLEFAKTGTLDNGGSGKKQLLSIIIKKKWPPASQGKHIRKEKKISTMKWMETQAS